ncbi:MAG: hypothetical protein WD468_07490 [Pirellulales bacterium]
MFAQFDARISRFHRVLWSIVGGAGLLFAAASPVWAERPSAMKLFPEDTLVFVRMRDAQEFGERLRESSTGRMVRDPQVAPLIEDLYGKASELYSEQAEAILGVSWADLQKLPQGEVAFGVVARPGQMPALLLLIDQGGEGLLARKLLDRGLEFATEKGAEFSSEKIGGVEVTVLRDPERPERMFGVCERENTIVIATDSEVLHNVLWHWDSVEGAESGSEAVQKQEKSDGEAASAAGNSPDENTTDEQEEEFVPGRTLADNTKFSALLRQCRRPQDPPPHAILFVDPIGLFREFSASAPGSQIALGFLPMLGLDGLAGLGGTLTFATGPFDQLVHIHLLLDNPRAGVLQLVTFESGDTTPQPFIPFATENYYSGRWNAGVFYDRLKEMIDKLLGADTFEKQFVQKATDATGLDVRTEIADNLAGRITWVSGYEKPAQFRSQKHTLIFELVDETKAGETLQKVRDKYPEDFEERRFGSVTYYAITPEWWRDMEEEQRPFNPFVAITDGNLFLGGSCQLFEEMIAARDGTINRLADSEDYARVTATLDRETAGTKPVLFQVSRPEESMRQIYELLTSEESRKFIEERAEEQPVMAKLSEALKDHQLPAFETLIQYFGPGGGIMYDTDSGYHGISFTLRNEAAR